jgi:hypothetical protein
MSGFCWYGVNVRLSPEELAKVDSQERMNIFRRYFAASRYNRLLIQQALVKSADERPLAAMVKNMEQAHNRDFFDTIRKLKKWGFFEEFLVAVREEDEALSKIIEAYDKRMNRS